MTTEEKRNLKPGDRVIVRRGDNEREVCTVKIAPWQLGHGEWVIGLAGIAGGYDLDRVIDKEEERTP